jgi:MFS family permease
MTTGTTARLGLRANVGQFTLLVAVNGLVGGMIGQERTVLPLLASGVFRLTGFTVVLTFVLAFGVTKALANLAAGALADRYGRKPVLVAGWLFGLPVPLLLIWAPDWSCLASTRGLPGPAP